MTLENTVLQKLSEWQPPPGRQEFFAAADGWTVSVTADRSDALGCLVWEFSLRRDGSAEVDVQQWATASAERVGGLMEPLKVVEVDVLRKVAQLRSESLSPRGDKRLYHELLLGGIANAELRRFQTASGGTAREQVPFAVTHETLARLAGDLAAAV